MKENSINPAIIPIPGGGASFPIAIAIRADGLQALICNFNSSTITILDLTDPTSPALVNTLAVGISPTSAIYTIDGTFAYVTDSANAKLSRIDLSNYSSIDVTGIPAPSWMIMAPDGLTAYVSSVNDLYPVTNLTGTPVVQLPIHGFNFSSPNFFPQLVISSDGTTLLATDTGDSAVQPLIFPGTLGNLIGVGVTPNGITISPDSSFSYVCNGNGSSEIAVITNPIGPSPSVTEMTPSLQTTPTDVATTPDQAPLAFFTANTALPDLNVSFDASSSQSPTDSITNYAWDFGDGSPIVDTASPLITHHYAHPGHYTVNLQVTNTAGTSTSVTFTGQIVSRNGGPTAIMSLPIAIPFAEISQASNKFLTKTGYENCITFQVPAGANPPVLFRIYADAGLTELLATVPASDPSVCLCSSHKHTTYFVELVDALGNVTGVAKITI